MAINLASDLVSVHNSKGVLVDTVTAPGDRPIGYVYDIVNDANAISWIMLKFKQQTRKSWPIRAVVTTIAK